MNSLAAAFPIAGSGTLAAWAMALLTAYLLLVAACALGRLRLYRRPADAPLIVADGPELGDAAPEALLAALAAVPGAEVGSRPGMRTAVLFMAPTCGPCTDLAPSLPAVARRWRSEARFVIVLDTGGITERHPSMEAWRAPGVPVLVDAEGDWTGRLGVRHRPLALLIDARGIVRMKGVVSTHRHLDGLLQGWGVSAGGRTWSPVAEPLADTAPR